MNRIKLTLGALGLAGILSGIGMQGRINQLNTKIKVLQIENETLRNENSSGKLRFSERRPDHGYFKSHNGDTYFVLDMTEDKVPDEVFIIKGITYADPNMAWRALREGKWDKLDFKHYVVEGVKQEQQYVVSRNEVRVSREKLAEIIPVPYNKLNEREDSTKKL